MAKKPEGDTLSREKREAHPPGSLPGKLDSIADKARSGLGKAANHFAKSEMLSDTKSHPDLDTKLQLEDVWEGANRFKCALEPSTMTMENGEEVGGWVLEPREASNPTVVFYGGSDFDRTADDYKAAIMEMANDASKQGMGFAVFDYPKKFKEESVNGYVKDLQTHLSNEHKIPLNHQAYSGFSQGSYAATQSAAINPDAAGLQVVSGFSSAYQAQKDEIQSSLGPLSSAVKMRELTEVWDNVANAREIAANQAGKDLQMPIHTTTHEGEKFGMPGNKHMTPLTEALKGGPDGTVEVNSTISNVERQNIAGKNALHLKMLSDPEAKAAFKGFTESTKNFSNQRDQQVRIGEDTILENQAPAAGVDQNPTQVERNAEEPTHTEGEIQGQFQNATKPDTERQDKGITIGDRVNFQPASVPVAEQQAGFTIGDRLGINVDAEETAPALRNENGESNEQEESQILREEETNELSLENTNGEAAKVDVDSIDTSHEVAVSMKHK